LHFFLKGCLGCRSEREGVSGSLTRGRVWMEGNMTKLMRTMRGESPLLLLSLAIVLSLWMRCATAVAQRPSPSRLRQAAQRKQSVSWSGPPEQHMICRYYCYCLCPSALRHRVDQHTHTERERERDLPTLVPTLSSTVKEPLRLRYYDLNTRSVFESCIFVYCSRIPLVLEIMRMLFG
jgi:hypothetical protein